MNTGEPLEKRRLTVNVNGIDRQLPAIHIEWIVPREWVAFVSAPNPWTELTIVGAKDTWMSHCKLVLEDILFLLECPYHVFWSYVTFDRDLLRQTGRLLKSLPRPHDFVFPYPDSDIQSLLHKVTYQSFRLILRLSTYKESKCDHMSPEFYANLVYDNFVFDIPKMIDICSIYSLGNHKLVEKIVQNLLTCQPRYLQDLKSCCSQILESLQMITAETEKCLQDRDESTQSSSFQDVISMAVDTASGLYSLVEAGSQISETCHRSDSDFTIKLAQFYNGCLHAIDEKIHEEVFDGRMSESDACAQAARICRAKVRLLRTVRTTIMTCILDPVMNGSSKTGYDGLEKLLHLYTGFLSESCFFSDYVQFYPLDDDLDIFKQIGVQVDQTRIEYLKDGLRMIHPRSKPEVHAEESQGAAALLPPNKSTTAYDESLVSHIRDLFPQLGIDFIAHCLPFYNEDSEKLINALLEDNLPPHLSDLDRRTGEKTVAQEQASAKMESQEIDEMEFSKLHKGKRRVAKNANALLDDKSDLMGMRERFSALSIVTDDIYLHPEDAEYDDEYDDTYDENARGEAEPDALEREFVLPRALGGGHVSNGKKNGFGESDDDENDEGDGGQARLDFARNPEEIRQEAEQRRQSKLARGNKKPHVQASRNVVGNPKGQGQDKQVLINRARKNANKNKHQRAMADRKQAKGMF